MYLVRGVERIEYFDPESSDVHIYKSPDEAGSSCSVKIRIIRLGTSFGPFSLGTNCENVTQYILE